MEYRCIGCGALLQTENQELKGYIEQAVFDKHKENSICKRCFNLAHYNEEIVIDSNYDFLLMLQSIGKEDALIVSLVDIFDFAGTFVPSVKRHTGQSDIILVGNKRDLIPKSVKNDKLAKWMRHMAKKDGLTVLDVAMISAKTGEGIDELMTLIDKHQKKRKVYIVGVTNVGKSTLINSIIKKYTDAKKDIITTSNIPGTTLDFIEIPYNDTFIVDTPGIVNEAQGYNLLSRESLNMIMPTKEIKPIVFQLNSDQCVFISGMAIMKFILGPKSSFVFYFSEKINLHRTKIDNYDRIKASIGEFLVPPKKEEIKGYTRKTFKVPNDKKYDIVVSGLGFITISQEVLIEMETMQGVDVYMRESII